MHDIYLIGTGILSILHLTTEAKQVISVCKRMYVLHDDISVIQEIRTMCSDTRDLAVFYETDATLRCDVYNDIAAEVVGSASHVRPVGMAVHGNPMFLVSAVENILHLARHADLRVKVVPGVSSLDTIQCDLGIDLGYSVQVYDSTLLFEQRVNVDPRVPLLIFQLATFQNPRLVRAEPGPAILEPLIDYLERFYPRTHRCSIVYSATSVLDAARIVDVELGALAHGNSFNLWERPTLYVPATQSQFE